MLKHLLTALLLLALGALLGACGGMTSITATEWSGVRISASLDPAASIHADGAQLALTPLTGPETGYALTAHELNGAKALYGTISYDPSLMHFAGSQPSGRMPEDGLVLCVDTPEAGRVDFGWVLPNFSERPGRSGRLEICRVSFAAGAASVVRRASIAPSSNDNAFTISGQLLAGNIPTLTWIETNYGDGDNNGEVNISDLTPLGQQFGKTPGPGAADSQARDADYDKNGAVNISDMTIIGRNWHVVLTGYAILAGPNADNLSELTRLARTDMFNPKPGAADGELTWAWTGAAIAANTTYRVQPYDAAGDLGKICDNSVTLNYVNPIANITGIEQVTFDEATTWFDLTGTDYTILLTELSVDDTAGNAEALTGVVESIQLKGMVTTDLDPGPVDGTERLIWYLTEGAGLAEVSNAPGTKGKLTFHDRGRVVVEAQVPGNFTKVKNIAFALMSIDSLALQLSAGGTGPANVNAGATVGFKAMGTFDFDNVTNGNEYTVDITPHVNWGAITTPSNLTYAIDTTSGVLDTTGTSSGNLLRVTCEFPRTDNVTLYDNAKRASNFVNVNIN